MANLRDQNASPFLFQTTSPLTLLICLLALSLTFPIIKLPQVEAQSVDCNKNAESCVCSSLSIVEYFSEALHVPSSIYSRAPHVIFDRIESFHCGEYLPLPPNLLVRMSEGDDALQQQQPKWRYFSKRRYRAKREVAGRGRSRKRRQLSLGIPNEEKFEEVIASIPAGKSHFYALLGSEITLHCYGEGRNGWEEQGVSGSFRRFEWTHGNNQPITAPLVQLDSSTGDLTFKSVRLADTGIYTCAIRSGEEDSRRREDMQTKRFRSQLDVIASPMMWLRFGITYGVDRCRHKELLDIQRQIKDLVHQYVCHFCPVRNISVNCVNFGGGGEGMKYVELSLTLSTMGLERLLPQWEHSSFMCPVNCQDAMHTKVFSVLQGSLMKLFNLQILVEHIDGKTTIYSPEPQSITDDLAIGCPAGFFENYKLCFPCAAGHYSPHGKSDCVSCLVNHFQPNPGSSDCFRCPRGHSTLKPGSRSQMDCVLDAVSSSLKFAKFHWIIVVSCAGGLAFLILLCICIGCCCPNSCCGRCCGCKEETEGDGHNQEKKSGKYEKLINEPDDDGDNDRGEFHQEDSARHSRKSKQSRRFSREEDNYDDDDDRTSTKSPPKKESAPKPIGHLPQIITELEQNTMKSSPSPKNRVGGIRPIRGTQTQNFSKRKSTHPMSSSSPPRRLPVCNYRIVDMDHHQLSEQIPARPYYRDDESSWQSSDNSSNIRRTPHLNLGKVLNTSESLAEKLGVQRRKLGDRSTGRTRNRSVSSSSRSSRSRSESARSPSRPRLPPPPPPKRAGKKPPPSKHPNRVNIVEAKNTYHAIDKRKKKSSKNLPSRKSTAPAPSDHSDSSIFRKPVSERIKSFSKR